MSRIQSSISRAGLFLSIFCLAGPLAFAQGQDSGPPLGNCGPGSQFGDHGSGHGFGGPPPRGSFRHDGTSSTMRGGLQLGPPGRWWDDRDFANSLGLRPDQKDKMDTIFNANKGTIVERYQSLRQEEAHMEDSARQGEVNEAAIFASIDRVAQARAALEKANAHMLLLIRQNMDKAQIDLLEQHR